MGGYFWTPLLARSTHHASASFAIITDAKDEDAQAFYEHYGGSSSFRPKATTVASSSLWGRWSGYSRGKSVSSISAVACQQVVSEPPHKRRTYRRKQRFLLCCLARPKLEKLKC